MKYSFSFRTKIIALGILLFALILVTKLFLVQVVHSSSYSLRADRQYATPSSNIFEPGTIFFERRDGQFVSAATQVSGFKIAIDPSKITNEESVYKKLSEIIVLNQEDFSVKAEKKNDTYEEIAHRLSKEEADAVSALKITGIFIYLLKFFPISAQPFPGTKKEMVLW